MEIREDLSPIRRRAAIALFAAVGVFVLLLLRIGQLQLLESDRWRRQAEDNRLRRIPLASKRGLIYDRHGRVLAGNLPTWQVLLFPDEAHDLDQTALFLARAGVTSAAVLRRQIDERRIGRLAPLVVAENLSWDQVVRIRSHQSDHPELTVVSGFRRHYPQGAATAHVVGYLRMISKAEVDAAPARDPNAMVGAIGIEQAWDGFLAGSDGERYLVASAAGQQLGVVRERPATPGSDLGTTIDLDLQLAAVDAMAGAAGAVVALEPATGAVRVLYSAPGFEPDLFVSRMSHDDWRLLSSDPDHPLQNRAINGTYPPGSTIKPFLALGGLATGAITPTRTVSCRGSVTLYGHRFRCWRRSGHGTVAVRRSLEVSCDTFYYLLGQRLTIDGIAGWLARFGFGASSGIGLDGEAPGLIGTPEWSERVRGTPWYPGEAVSMSIGQGPLLVTALQLAVAYGALANGGRLVMPHVVESLHPRPPVDLGLDPADLALVVDGLVGVVHGAEGTARSLSRLPVAGKTGTSQVARLLEDVDVDDLPVHLRHHAWFVGWAPLDEPELVVAVIVEHGGGGGGVAAPVAGRVLQAAAR